MIYQCEYWVKIVQKLQSSVIFVEKSIKNGFRCSAP
jgi:hypothetical protein